MKKVVVAGHICIDIAPRFMGKKIDNVSEILLPGKLIQVGDVDIHTGGAVANTGLAMKILGADVSLMGKLGNDEIGDMTMNILKQYNADKGVIISEGESSSYTIVLSMPGIDRIFLHNPGANRTFTDADISDEALEGISLFHFGYPSLMPGLYADEGAGLIRMYEKVKNHGIATSLDLTAIDPESEAGRVDWNEVIKKVLPYVDFFVPSAEELCYCIDRDRFNEWTKRAAGRDMTLFLDPDKDVKPLADKCLEYGAKVVLIKCGVPGMYYLTSPMDRMKELCEKLDMDINDWSNKSGFERSYVPREVVSGTGAGDTTIAAFLTAILNGETLENCLHLAAATGASCVEAVDALSGLKSFDELRKKIADGWEKQ